MGCLDIMTQFVTQCIVRYDWSLTQNDAAKITPAMSMPNELSTKMRAVKHFIIVFLEGNTLSPSTRERFFLLELGSCFLLLLTEETSRFFQFKF